MSLCVAGAARATPRQVAVHLVLRPLCHFPFISDSEAELMQSTQNGKASLKKVIRVHTDLFYRFAHLFLPDLLSFSEGSGCGTWPSRYKQRGVFCKHDTQASSGSDFKLCLCHKGKCLERNKKIVGSAREYVVHFSTCEDVIDKRDVFFFFLQCCGGWLWFRIQFSLLTSRKKAPCSEDFPSLLCYPLFKFSNYHSSWRIHSEPRFCFLQGPVGMSGDFLLIASRECYWHLGVRAWGCW